MNAQKSTGQEDPLYSIFEEHLHSGMYDAMPAEQFIRDVVDFYWKTILLKGHVPQRLPEPLQADLAQDVQDMLKTKIYGHYGIGEYNRIRRGKLA